MKKLIDNKLFVLFSVVVINIAFVLIVINTIGLMFDSTDDVGMCYVANGKMFGIPDNHLVFINAIYGTFLASLYVINPNIEWYSVLFLIIHIISFTAISLCILNDKRTIVSKLIMFVILYVFWIRCITGFQFTTTAGIACFAGCLLIIRDSFWEKFIGALFIVVASLIRFEMAAFIGLLFSPMVIYSYGRNYKNYIVCFVMLIVVLCAHKADQLFYQTEEWKIYLDYNQKRSKINDNPNARVLFDTEIDGLSKNDNLMILGTEQDVSIIDANTLSEVNNVVLSKTKLSRLKNVYQLKYYFVILLFFSVVLLIILVSKVSLKIKILALSSLCLFVSLLMFKSIDWYLKDRVVIPAIVPLTYIFITCLFESELNHKINVCMIFVIGLFVSFTFMKQIIEVYNSKKSLDDIWNKQYALMKRNGLDMLWPSDVYEQGLNPLALKSNDINYIFGGWFLSYPAENVLHNHKELIDKKIGILLSNQYGWDTLIINHYVCSLKENYDIDAEVTKIDTCDEFSIYALSRDSDD